MFSEAAEENALSAGNKRGEDAVTGKQQLTQTEKLKNSATNVRNSMHILFHWTLSQTVLQQLCTKKSLYSLAKIHETKKENRENSRELNEHCMQPWRLNARAA